MIRNSKGVTIIALIITIIVLLILTNVGVSALFGNDGILTKAQNASETARNTQVDEKVQLYIVGLKIISSTESKTLSEALEKSKLPQGFTRNENRIRDIKTEREYIISNDFKVSNVEKPKTEWENSIDIIVDGVPIPKRFQFVRGTKNTGLVVKDEDNNEFVWVPTDNTPFARKTWETEVLTETATMNAYWEDTTTDEYKEMKASVERYNGFYIARYEASFGSGININDCKPLSKPTTAVGYESAFISQQGKLWNAISQEDAIKASSNMYSPTINVVSHLIYGIQWDTTLQWLINSESKKLYEIANDSTSWGNYAVVTFPYDGGVKKLNFGGLLNTGVVTEPVGRNSANNIYDLSGNLFEFTQEKYSTSGEIVIRRWILLSSSF